MKCSPPTAILCTICSSFPGQLHYNRSAPEWQGFPPRAGPPGLFRVRQHAFRPMAHGKISRGYGRQRGFMLQCLHLQIQGRASCAVTGSQFISCGFYASCFSECALTVSGQIPFRRPLPPVRGKGFFPARPLCMPGEGSLPRSRLTRQRP